MTEVKADIYFFPWFERTYKKINTINRTTQNWFKKENIEVIHEEYYPYESILITHKGTQVIASSIKIASCDGHFLFLFSKWNRTVA
jgi:hypothetical protein